MSTIAIFPILMMVLLVFGGLAAVVFFAVRALANKGSGSFGGAFRFLVTVVLIGLAMIVGWRWLAPPQLAPAVIHDQHGHTVYVGNGIRHDQNEWLTTASSRADGIGNHRQFQIGTRLTFGNILLIVVAIVLLAAFVRRGDKAEGASHSGWAVFGILALLFFVGVPVISYQSSHIETANPHIDEVRIAHDVDQRIKNDPNAQQVVDEVAQELGGLSGQSMQEIWERLHEPRIALNGASESTSTEIEVAKGKSSDPSDVSAISHAHNQGTAETLANKAERVARLARLLAVVADQVSDVAAAVGRGFVAAEQPQEDPSTANDVAIDEATPAEQVEADENIDEATATPERPAWVDAPPKRFGENWREVVMVGDYATREECEREADRLLLLATHRHLQSLSGASNSRRPQNLTSGTQFDHPMIMVDAYSDRAPDVGVGVDYIRRNIVKDWFYETVERSFGDMERLYIQLEFTPSVDRELKSRWDAHRREERLAMVGAGTGSLLGLIGLLFGLLKLDTLTRGYYTKRLFLGVPAAIIGLIALLALMVS